MSSDPFRHAMAKFLPFRDLESCARVRAITREHLTEHANPDFRITIVDNAADFYLAFAQDFVSRIQSAREAGSQFVAILPCGPMPQYRLAAELINRQELSLAHVHTFNMDEYADEDGVTAPRDWVGSFQRAMWEGFFSLVRPDLRPNPDNVHFPTSGNITTYSAEIEAIGGADVCYGGIGWSGHMAFWEPQLGEEFHGDLEAYKGAGARIVELSPMTIMQNALQSFGSDWSWVPPRAATIGPRDVLGARHRSFWLDADLGGGVSWQRFIARLVAHGPVNEFVPGSLLQTVPTDYVLLGSVADTVEVHVT
jgi:glucosamine-6-phosphate deaminase